MTKEMFKAIRDEFFKRLEAKTGWGKEEVKKLFIEIVTEKLLEGES